MYGSRAGTGYNPGQARFANAVYIYKPNFKNGDYREGVIEETDYAITFELYTPYIIAATPPNDRPWGVYDAGCSNGLVLSGHAACAVSISVDQGATWKDCGQFKDGMDLTDHAKGHRQYFLRFGAPAKELDNSGLTIRTVCQAAVGIIPRLHDGETTVTLAASKQALISAGPNKAQAARHIVAGAFDSPSVTLKIESPRREPINAIYAAAQIGSGNPPSTDISYQIDWSSDEGRTWKPLVKDWKVVRRGEEPTDFWSQSFCYGSTDVAAAGASSVEVRFRNNGGKNYLRAEASLVYRTASQDAAQVAFGWKDDKGIHTESHVFEGDNPQPWKLATGRGVETRWVEFAVVEQ